MSPNQGQVWNLMPGGVGNPLILDIVTDQHERQPGQRPDPQRRPGPDRPGRARPDRQRRRRMPIYGAGSMPPSPPPTARFDGLFVTKDFGQNWTQVRIPTVPDQGYPTSTRPSPPTTSASRLPDHRRSPSSPPGQLRHRPGRRPDQPQRRLPGRHSRRQPDRADPHRHHQHLGCPLPGRLLDRRQRRRGPDLATSARPRSTNSHAVRITDRLRRPSSYLNFIRNPENPFVADATPRRLQLRQLHQQRRRRRRGSRSTWAGPTTTASSR